MGAPFVIYGGLGLVEQNISFKSWFEMKSSKHLRNLLISP